MPRQSITLSPKNDVWLRDQASGDEFQNKSEVINSLIREARQEDEIRKFLTAALIEGEQGKPRTINPESLRERVKQTLRANGKI